MIGWSSFIPLVAPDLSELQRTFEQKMPRQRHANLKHKWSNNCADRNNTKVIFPVEMKKLRVMTKKTKCIGTIIIFVKILRIFHSPIFLHISQTADFRERTYKRRNEWYTLTKDRQRLKPTNMCRATVNNGPNFYYLIKAIEEGSIEQVVKLAAAGAPVNQRTPTGETPLFLAVSMQLDSIVVALVRFGANVNLSNYEGETPLHVAAAAGNVNYIKFLVAHGAHLNCSDSCGDSPLHWAVRESNEEAVRVLIQLGASINSQNEDKETPLHFAANFGDKKIVLLLINGGANVLLRDMKGSLPVDEAKECGSYEIVQLFEQLSGHRNPAIYCV
jgi:ankyrin repeat protein